VTRRPIEIQLIQRLEEDDEWFEVFERKGEKIRDSDEVRKVIDSETEKVLHLTFKACKKARRKK
jgi:dynamin 1-like protein